MRVIHYAMSASPEVGGSRKWQCEFCCSKIPVPPDVSVSFCMSCGKAVGNMSVSMESTSQTSSVENTLTNNEICQDMNASSGASIPKATNIKDEGPSPPPSSGSSVDPIVVEGTSSSGSYATRLYPMLPTMEEMDLSFAESCSVSTSTENDAVTLPQKRQHNHGQHSTNQKKKRGDEDILLPQTTRIARPSRRPPPPPPPPQSVPPPKDDSGINNQDEGHKQPTSGTGDQLTQGRELVQPKSSQRDRATTEKSSQREEPEEFYDCQSDIVTKNRSEAEKKATGNQVHLVFSGPEHGVVYI